MTNKRQNFTNNISPFLVQCSWWFNFHQTQFYISQQLSVQFWRAYCSKPFVMPTHLHVRDQQIWLHTENTGCIATLWCIGMKLAMHDCHNTLISLVTMMNNSSSFALCLCANLKDFSIIFVYCSPAKFVQSMPKLAHIIFRSNLMKFTKWMLGVQYSSPKIC